MNDIRVYKVCHLGQLVEETLSDKMRGVNRSYMVLRIQKCEYIITRKFLQTVITNEMMEHRLCLK